MAAAVIHGPEVLFLDEPFEGVDAIAAGTLKAMLNRMIERGATIFLTSHVLEIVERLCSHVAIIHRGELVAQGSIDELRSGVSARFKAGQVNFCASVATGCDPSHILGSAQLTSAGTATLKCIPGIGVHSYKAVFMATNADAGSTSAAPSLTVTASRPTTTTIAETGSAGNYTLTATVAGQGAVAPTGTISFLDTSNNNSILGTAPLGAAKAAIAWGNPQSPGVGTNAEAIAVGDFNGDGIPDLAVMNASQTVTILLGKGDGTFTATATSPQTGASPSAIVIGDFNSDGIPDLAVANEGSNNVSIFLGNGDGTFTAVANQPETGTSPIAMVAGDFNGDGILDLATANYVSDTVTVLLGNGDGTFTASPLSAQTNVAPTPMAVGDFNGDGILDLAVAGGYLYPGGQVTILLGNGDGSFTPAAPLTMSQNSYAYPIVVGDFNQDGKLDLAIANSYGNSIDIFLGNGDGTFTATTATVTGLTGPSHLAVSDLNGDGKPDLVETNNSQVGILLGNGDGSFSAVTTLSAGNYPNAIVTSDFNEDGTEDLAVTNTYASTVTIFTSQLSQTVTATATGISPAGTATHNVEASYPGDTSYQSSVSSGVGVQAELVTPTVAVTPSSSSITTTQSLTVSVAVAGGTGSPTPTGSVTLASGSYTSAAATLSNGSATVNVPAGSLAVGSDTLTITYTPDTAASATYNSANGLGSVSVTQATGTTTPSVTATLSAASITNLQSVTVSVTVTGLSGQSPPTGAVNLSSGSYSAQQTLSSGSASFTIAAGTLAGGANTLTAAYSGDETYAAANGTTTVTVVPVILATPTLNSVLPGSSASGNVTLTAGGNYSGTMTLSCTLTSSPSGAQSLPTCNLSPTSVTLASGGTATSALTIGTTASTASLVPPAQFRLRKLGGAGSLLAVLVMLSIPARRRRWASMFVLLFIFVLAGAIGCGGGGNPQSPPNNTPATSAGTYSFAVKATDSSANVTASANVTLTVQ